MKIKNYRFKSRRHSAKYPRSSSSPGDGNATPLGSVNAKSTYGHSEHSAMWLNLSIYPYSTDLL